MKPTNKPIANVIDEYVSETYADLAVELSMPADMAGNRIGYGSRWKQPSEFDED